jgi:hypothetical protein
MQELTAEAPLRTARAAPVVPISTGGPRP